MFHLGSSRPGSAGKRLGSVGYSSIYPHLEVGYKVMSYNYHVLTTDPITAFPDTILRMLELFSRSYRHFMLGRSSQDL